MITKFTGKSFIPVSLVMLFAAASCFSQAVPRAIKTAEYKLLQEKLCSGWNTWYNNSVLSQVLLPEGFCINLCLKNARNSYLRESYKVSKTAGHEEKVVLGLRSDDGSYTSLKLQWNKTGIFVQTARDGEDIVLLVSPDPHPASRLVIEAGILWNRQGTAGREDQKLMGKFGAKTITVQTTAPMLQDDYTPTSNPYLIASLENEIGIFTGRNRSLKEIKDLIEQKRQQQLKRMSSYGELSDAFQAMQTILAWNTIYDAPNNRVISPVSRSWNANWGGFVLFDWDTYFASYMCSLFNKDLAYANAIEITKAITPAGFIPNFSSAYNNCSWDRSQPPVGSMIINQIYKRYKEKWFLEEVYDELLTWNRWWPKNREIKGYLAWGSNEVSDPGYDTDHAFIGAILESGLDNSPMYDSVPFNPNTNTMELADVGLMSFYIMDCNSLAEISDILGKKTESKEIRERAEKYSKVLATLWDESSGIFLNRRTDTNMKSYHLSPTNFYPMLAKACTQKQAERMIREHYFNTKEFYGEYVMPSIARNDPGFHDNNYWRGRIWAPMNFLVYLGMRNYDLPEARADLISKSAALLMKSWKENGAIYENYNSVTGQGDDVNSADSFYHWGALLTFMSFIEKGYMDAADASKK